METGSCADSVAYISQVKELIKSLIKFVNDYKWLSDAYLSDYFVLEHWKKVNPSWWRVLNNMDILEMTSLLRNDNWKSRQVWPLGLLAFRATAHTYPLSRLPRDPTVTIKNLIQGCRGPNSNNNDIIDQTAGAYNHLQTGRECSPNAEENCRELLIKDGQYLLLEHCYRRHVKPKKQHEITLLAKAIYQLCSARGSSRVIDIGAGQGHLCRLLSFGYGLDVTTIEAASCHAPKATRFDQEVKRDISRGQCISRKEKRKVTKAGAGATYPEMEVREGPEPSHIVAWIDSDISVANFLQRIETAGSRLELTSRPVQDALVFPVVEKQLATRSEPYSSGVKQSGERVLSSHETNQCGRCLKDACDLHLNNKPLCDGQYHDNCNSHVVHSSTDALEMDTLSSEDITTFNSRSDTDGASLQAQVCSSMAGITQGSDTVRLDKDDSSLVHISAEDSSSQTFSHRARSIVSTSSLKGVACEGDAGSGENSDTEQSFVLTGLHACGDLTPTLLRVFARCPQAVGLASVGCCYMKMDIHEADRGERELGYPMSQFVGNLSNHHLSWEAREMACHFVDAYLKRLIDAYEDPEGDAMAHLRTQCYRAALQGIVQKKDPSAQHGSVKLTLKKTHCLPFKKYAEKALVRLGLDPTLDDEDEKQAAWCLEQWRSVVAFYVLRLSLAPVLESLVLLDRVLYLEENGIHGALVPVFNPALSPRNFVLLAAKSGL